MLKNRPKAAWNLYSAVGLSPTLQRIQICAFIRLIKSDFLLWRCAETKSYHTAPPRLINFSYGSEWIDQ